jgi:DNA polymerase-3 subunit alpha
MSFAHLHVHNEYSLLDGYGKACQYIKRAKDLGYNYIGLTNHGDVSGCIQWQKECDKYNISPILGCEAYIVPDVNIKMKENRGHIVILVKNNDGWIELCKLLTKANLEGFYRKPRIDYNWLLNCDLSNLIILTGCFYSFINLEGGIEFLKQLREKIPNQLYLEVMPHDFSQQRDHNKKILSLHESLNLPLVVTNDCHYVLEEDWECQEVLLAIQTKAKWNDKDRWKFNIKRLHLKTEEEIRNDLENNIFSLEQIDSAILNSVKIARQCYRFRIPKQEINLPSLYKGGDYDRLASICQQNLSSFFNQDIPSEYQNRLDYELEVIKNKNFAKYFLIVEDLLNWCSKEDIMVGPGRGSVSGSLVAFCLKITLVDPIKFNLLFSRFISEERIDYPDIDMDFEKIKRDRVLGYLSDKYGKNNICSIATDLEMKARGVVRDVARVFDVPYVEVNEFTKKNCRSSR